MASASEPEPLSTRLSLADCGPELWVRRIEVPGDDANRLRRMGICVGRPIVLLQAGDPMIIRAVGSQLALSRHLADGVLVQLDRPTELASAPEP